MTTYTVQKLRGKPERFALAATGGGKQADLDQCACSCGQTGYAVCGRVSFSADQLQAMYGSLASVGWNKSS